MNLRYFLSSALASAGLVPAALAQQSITSYFGYTTENFNGTISSGSTATLPGGWLTSPSGRNAFADDGSTSTTHYYLYGSSGSSERAFGSLSLLAATFGVYFQNDTGRTITQLSIAYTGEQWRQGALGGDSLGFAYSTTAGAALDAGTWIAVSALDFNSPVTTGSTDVALVGNNSPNFSRRSAVINGLSIANGGTFTLRWQDLTATGNNDGLAVDDFVIAVPEPATVGAGLSVAAMTAAGWYRGRRSRRAKA